MTDQKLLIHYLKKEKKVLKVQKFFRCQIISLVFHLLNKKITSNFQSLHFNNDKNKILLSLLKKLKSFCHGRETEESVDDDKSHERRKLKIGFSRRRCSLSKLFKRECFSLVFLSRFHKLHMQNLDSNKTDNGVTNDVM